MVKRKKNEAPSNKCGLFSSFTHLVHLNGRKLNCLGQIFHVTHPFVNRFIKDVENRTFLFLLKTVFI